MTEDTPCKRAGYLLAANVHHPPRKGYLLAENVMGIRSFAAFAQSRFSRPAESSFAAEGR